MGVLHFKRTLLINVVYTIKLPLVTTVFITETKKNEKILYLELKTEPRVL